MSRGIIRCDGEEKKMTRDVSEGGYVGPKLGAEERIGWDENDLGNYDLLRE